ncbi:unnamed protein product [Boreogadus saida]
MSQREAQNLPDTLGLSPPCPRPQHNLLHSHCPPELHNSRSPVEVVREETSFLKTYRCQAARKLAIWRALGRSVNQS